MRRRRIGRPKAAVPTMEAVFISGSSWSEETLLTGSRCKCEPCVCRRAPRAWHYSGVVETMDPERWQNSKRPADKRPADKRAVLRHLRSCDACRGKFHVVGPTESKYLRHGQIRKRQPAHTHTPPSLQPLSDEGPKETKQKSGHFRHRKVFMIF